MLVASLWRARARRFLAGFLGDQQGLGSSDTDGSGGIPSCLAGRTEEGPAAGWGYPPPGGRRPSAAGQAGERESEQGVNPGAGFLLNLFPPKPTPQTNAQQPPPPPDAPTRDLSSSPKQPTNPHPTSIQQPTPTPHRFKWQPKLWVKSRELSLGSPGGSWSLSGLFAEAEPVE